MEWICSILSNCARFKANEFSAADINLKLLIREALFDASCVIFNWLEWEKKNRGVLLSRKFVKQKCTYFIVQVQQDLGFKPGGQYTGKQTPSSLCMYNESIKLLTGMDVQCFCARLAKEKKVNL